MTDVGGGGVLPLAAELSVQFFPGLEASEGEGNELEELSRGCSGLKR